MTGICRPVATEVSMGTAERIFVQTNVRRAPRAAFNGYNIETPGNSGSSALGQKSPGHALDVKTLIRRHRFFRLTGMLIRAAARFHFDKREHRAIVTDQINFRLVPWHTIVPRHKHVSVAPQVPIRIRLAVDSMAPRVFFLRFVRLGNRQAAARRELHKTENGAREAALLQHLQLKLHHFSSHHVAQIEFPKSPEAQRVIHQEFESEIAPNLKQTHAKTPLPDARARIP